MALGYNETKESDMNNISNVTTNFEPPEKKSTILPSVFMTILLIGLIAVLIVFPKVEDQYLLIILGIVAALLVGGLIAALVVLINRNVESNNMAIIQALNDLKHNLSESKANNSQVRPMSSGSSDAKVLNGIRSYFDDLDLSRQIRDLKRDIANKIESMSDKDNVEMDMLKDENASLKREKESNINDLNSYKEAYSSVRTEMSAIQDSLLLKDNELSALTQKNEDLAQANKKIEAEKSAREEELVEKLNAITALNAEMSRLEADNQNLQKLKEETDKAIAAVKNNYFNMYPASLIESNKEFFETTFELFFVDKKDLSQECLYAYQAVLSNISLLAASVVKDDKSVVSAWLSRLGESIVDLERENKASPEQIEAKLNEWANHINSLVEEKGLSVKIPSISNSFNSEWMLRKEGDSSTVSEVLNWGVLINSSKMFQAKAIVIC